MTKRYLAPVMIAAVSVCFTMAGCGEESKVKTSETVSTPDGKTTTTVEKKVDSSGSNPPANTAGETGAGATGPK